MARGRKKDEVEKVPTTVRIEKKLYKEVNDRFLDPITGRRQYASLSAYINALIRQDLEQE